MRTRQKLFLLGWLCLTLCACRAQSQSAIGAVQNQSTETQQEAEAKQSANMDSEKGTGEESTAVAGFEDLSWKSGMELSYACRFTVDSCGEYRLITVVDDGRYLLIPEGSAVPQKIPEDVTVLQKPLKVGYVAASSAYDLIRQLGALDRIRFVGTKPEDLYVGEVVKKLESGEILYAGKYSAPDFEQLLQEGCDFVVESTMINHKPEVKEKLEALDLPVLTEYSSYEKHPLGRLEWIKLYGLLLDREEIAEEYFRQQAKQMEEISGLEKTGLTVAFFYVNSSGGINVRKSGDYVAQMIRMAGGEYVPANTGEEESVSSTMNMEAEDFYLAAKDADILIYNGAIWGELQSVDDLIEKNQLFADFRAVKENRVYSTDRNFLQQTTGIGEFIEDLSMVLRDEKDAEYHFLEKLN